jgi:uncharacterized protein involved in exopolysaccharide biosynthesis
MSEDPKSSTKYVMVESGPSSDEDEIDLLELIRTLLQAWKTIVGIIILCTGLAVAYALYAPEVFKAETLLAPAQEEETAASSLLNKFGGLVSIAGVKDKSSSFMSRVLGTLKSRHFLENFILEHKLLQQIFFDQWNIERKEWIPRKDGSIVTISDGIDLLLVSISCEEDRATSLYTVSVILKDPQLASLICNKVVLSLNSKFRERAIQRALLKEEYLREELLKTSLSDMKNVLYTMLQAEKQKAMLANITKDAAFEVIDPAVSGLKIKPKRELIVALGLVCGGFLGIFTVFFAQVLKKLKSTNSEAVTDS